MKKSVLSEVEIKDLISRYESELRKLNYQVDNIRETIAELTGYLGEDMRRDYAPVPEIRSQTHESLRKKRGRPPKSQKEIAEPAPVVHAEKKGYKLSDWDNLVLESITSAGKALLTAEILDYVDKNLSKYNLPQDHTLAKNKVTRSLQKLVNRRGDLAKAKYAGKGFKYALPAWVGKRGKLDKKFA